MAELKEKPLKKELQVRPSKPDNKSMQPDGTWVSINYTTKIRRINAPKSITMLDGQKNAEETKKEKGRLLSK